MGKNLDLYKLLKMKKTIAILTLFIGLFAYAQEDNQSALTIKQIMQAENFVGVSPTDIFWSDDSKTIYFTWNPELEKIASLYKYELASKKISKVSTDEEKSLTGRYDVDYNVDESKKVYAKNGDIYLYDLKNNSLKALVTTFDTNEYNVSFTSDATEVVFERNDNLFKINLKN